MRTARANKTDFIVCLKKQIAVNKGRILKTRQKTRQKMRQRTVTSIWRVLEEEEFKSREGQLGETKYLPKSIAAGPCAVRLHSMLRIASL